MMKDIDSIYRHIDPLIHRYLLDAATMHSKDIHLRLFAYNVMPFHHVLTHVMSPVRILPQPITLYQSYLLYPPFIITPFVSLPRYQPHLSIYLIITYLVY